MDEMAPEGATVVVTGRNGWSVERLLLILTFVLSAIGFTFGVGVNWARITQNEADFKALQTTTVSRELYDLDKRYQAESMDRLTKALDRLSRQFETLNSQPK